MPPIQGAGPRAEWTGVALLLREPIAATFFGLLNIAPKLL